MTLLSRSLLLLSFLLGATRLTAAGAMDMKSEMKAEILSAYGKVSAALAADNLAAAKSAAAVLSEHAGMSGHKNLAAKADTLAKAAKIEAARGAFTAVSVAVEPLAAGQKDLVVMYCPMADSDWVQTTGKTQNPYFGQAMLACGSPKKMK